MSAIISDCGYYRYRLERHGSDGPLVGVVMVNPSTADATEDDPTIRKLKGFAERNGWGGFVVGNLFAFRTKDVKIMAKAADPVGPDNDLHLQDLFEEVDLILVAWGRLSKLPVGLRTRWAEVADMIHRSEKPVFQIGVPVEAGQPRHPLMPGYDTPILPWHDPRDLGL